MKTLFSAIALILISVLKSQTLAGMSAKPIFEAEDLLRGFTPNMSALEEKFPNDPQILLGLADLYHYAPSPEYWGKRVLMYRKVLEIDPNNKAAHSSLAMQVLVDFISQRGRVLYLLEMQQKYADDEGIQEVNIPSWDPLYEWLREDHKTVVIRDFNETRARLCSKLDRNLPEVFSELDKGEKFESENALYNYLRAHINFELGRDTEGLAEAERGANKPYLNNYSVQIAEARNIVLQKAGFPDSYRQIIVDRTEMPGRGLPRIDKIFNLAKQQETKGNLKKAAQIYEIVIRMADQVRQEPVPGQATGKRGDNEISRHIEEQAKRELSRIRSE